jgi:hypothetical protein
MLCASRRSVSDLGSRRQWGLTLEPSRVGLVGADLVVDLDETLLDNEGNLTAGKGVLQTVTDEDL